MENVKIFCRKDKKTTFINLLEKGAAQDFCDRRNSNPFGDQKEVYFWLPIPEDGEEINIFSEESNDSEEISQGSPGHGLPRPEVAV